MELLRPKSFQLLIPFILSVACESTPRLSTVPNCQPGTIEACECTAGQTGRRMCLMTEEFGACMCTSTAPDASSPMDSGEASAMDAAASMDAGSTLDTGSMIAAEDASSPPMIDAGMMAAEDASSPPMIDAGTASAPDASAPPSVDAGMAAADASSAPVVDGCVSGPRPSCAAVINPTSHTLCLDILHSIATGTSAFARVRLIRAPALSDPAGIQFDLVSDPTAILLPSTSVSLPPTNAAAPSFMVAANNSIRAPHVPGSVTALMFSLDPNARTASMNGDLIEFEIVSRGPTGDFELMFDNVVISNLSSMAQPFTVYHSTIKVR